jgi:hypothetical protein
VDDTRDGNEPVGRGSVTAHRGEADAKFGSAKMARG